jgi:hypothetical protein
LNSLHAVCRTSIELTCFFQVTFYVRTILGPGFEFKCHSAAKKGNSTCLWDIFQQV